MLRSIVPITVVVLLVSTGFAGIERSIELSGPDAINEDTRSSSTAISSGIGLSPSRDDDQMSGSKEENEMKGRPSIMGYIWDKELRPVHDASVHAFSKDGVEIASASSDSVDSQNRPTGFYALRGLPESELIVTVSHQALSGSAFVKVRHDSPVWLNFSGSEVRPPVIPKSRQKTIDPQPVGSFALYYLDPGIWSEDTLLPLVAHVSFAGSVMGRMYDGAMLYSGDRLGYKSNGFNGPSLSDFYWYLNSSFEALDLLENVSGKVRKALNDTVLFKVVLTAVYFKGDANASWSVDLMMERWASKKYANLTLSGFYWGYSEGEIDATYQGVNGTADRVHSLGLKFFWCPFFLAPMWPYWQEFKFDYVIMQPNFAYNKADPWRFEMITSLLASGEIHGVNFEISYTRNNGLTIEENANAYLDAGFKYAWWKNGANIFYRAPGYLDEYARGGINVPKWDRPIYDRQYQFLRSSEVITSQASNDTYVFERPAMLWQEVNGAKGEMVLRSDREIATRAFMRFPQIDRYSYIHSALLRLDVLTLERPCLVAIYVVDSAWDEAGLAWPKRPAVRSFSGLISLNSTGWLSFKVPKVMYDLSFMLVPQMVGCNAVISSKEGVAPPEIEVEHFVHVETSIPVSEDAYVSDVHPSENFGNLTYLLAGKNGTETTRTYLKFDAISLPKWYHEPILSIRGMASSSPVGLDLSSIGNSTWNETAITWASQPGGTWVTIAENVSLDKDLALKVRLSQLEKGNFTLILSHHIAPGDNWASLGSKGSGEGPVIFILLQAFEQQF